MERAKHSAKHEKKPLPKAAGKVSSGRFICGPVSFLMVLVFVFAVFAFRSSRNPSANSGLVSKDTTSVQSKSPKTLKELLGLKPNELEGMNIGLMNLLCAEGLRGAESLDLTECMSRLDGLASKIDMETKRHYYKFRDNPGEFRNSEAYFRMLYLFTVLQQDVGIQYNPERITPVGVFEPNEIFFADSRDVFIHGLIDDNRRMGTCSSLPVLYVAVGRRLSYPLKLVATKNHLFVRWEDNRFRFNIDATGVGMNVYDDEHYRQWPFPVTGEEMLEFGYLKSMAATEELTAFLSLRGQCLMSMGKVEEAVACQETALRFSPESRLQQLIAAKAREEMALRTVRWDLLPPEQLRHGSIPLGVPSHEIEVQLAVQRAEYLSRQKRGELPVLNSEPQGVPGFAPVVAPDPDPLKKIQNQFKSP